MIRVSVFSVLGLLANVVGCRSSSVAPESAEVFVPAGEFRAGAICTEQQPQDCRGGMPAIYPRTVLRLNAFYVDRRLVTRGEFQACVAAGACADVLGPPGMKKPAHPLDGEGVPYTEAEAAKWLAAPTFEQARVYCRWRGARLIGRDEFERIARGTDGRPTPWGDRPSPCVQKGTGSRACAEGMGPAGVREIAYSPQWVDYDEPPFPGGMIRGDGEYSYSADNGETTSSAWVPTKYAYFRCARDADPAVPQVPPVPMFPPR